MNAAESGTLTTFVCMATGEFYGLADVYINRMLGMLRAHVHTPFQLICVTDRVRQIDPTIQQIRCDTWTELQRAGMRATTAKIGLFNPDYLPVQDFIYLDLTLVIRQDMSPLLAFTRSSHAPLVIIKDWHYDSYNSSVMRIRSTSLRFIYDAFIQGETYPQKTKGDQDFIHAVIANRGQEAAVDCIPDGLVASFKRAVRTARSDPDRSRAMIDQAVIVKFHGSPRMHHVLNPIRRFLKYTVGNLWYGQLGLPFSVRALQQAWESPCADIRITSPL